ncbi:MAG: class II aldolase/adducin family protein [Methylomonas sp.]|nr:class II aldolase/adducin family protein [Methylomonas sp.]PPD20743.1 MAG: aldolase [Methylomonas sp.]PPD26234.1 MAG: aldolase [Methylomonas sp.]PPD37953.1 MAG: aldolase [Methylomonas sp.]PPD54653.1 MAG: aldolase [Methylomonas sp.]
MSDSEGVIKYRLTHRTEATDAALDIVEIDAWRALFHRLGLIGQTADRYDGLGFGNISMRLLGSQGLFLITGSQTGHLPRLSRSDFTQVLAASPAANYLESQGPCQPSSEALTHAAVYLQAPTANAVIHVHSPEIWRNTLGLGLPHTSGAIAYGTVTMASAVQGLFKAGDIGETGVFSMLGHEDGIVAIGPSLADAGLCLLKTLAAALAIECKSTAT